MTALVEKALAEIKSLSEEEQEVIASLILEELEDEKRWEESFARSQVPLAKMAEKARRDLESGRGKKVGFDQV